MTFPNPNTIEVLAEVADARQAMSNPMFATVTTIRSLSQYAGAADDMARQKYVGADAERDAMVRLAAYAVARIEVLDARK